MPFEHFTMSTYSFKKNLQYMVMAFMHPILLIDGMREESAVLFGFVPFVIEKILYEFAYFLDCYVKQPASLIQASPLLGNEYYFYKPFLAPLLEVVDILIFAVVIGSLARLFQYKKFDSIQSITFFMFLATFGLLAFVADVIYSYVFPLSFLLWIHPLVGAVALAYLTEFVARQAQICRSKSFALVLPAWIAYFAFRIPFFM